MSLSIKQKGLIFQDALPVKEIKDATGAGDAFWTGFLYAQLHKRTLNESITIAQKLTGIKLQNVGRLPDDMNINQLII